MVKQEQESHASAPETLKGRDFVTASIVDESAETPLMPGTSIRIHFHTDGNSLEATAGCNAIGGPYQLSTDWILEFTGDVMTKMWCGLVLSQQEEWLVRFLKSGPTVTLRGNTLELVSGTSSMTLIEPQEVDPDHPLLGRRWRLSSIRNGDELADVPPEVTASLQFGADGRVQIHTGCNHGFGSFQISEDGNVKISELALTRMLCAGTKGDVERSMLDILSGSSLRVRVQDLSLTLSVERALSFVPGDAGEGARE